MAQFRAVRRLVDGVLLLDKPTGLSSNAALQRAKRIYRAQKAGHTGTLDPLASGLLPLCFGEATKFAQMLLDAPKRYTATVRFGTTTTTADAEGEVLSKRELEFSRTELEAALRGFVGRQMQLPPAYSALKHEGRAYYEYARAGQEVPRVPREVEIHALALVDWAAPDAVLDVSCSKGTYIRVLAADLGEALGSGAHLAALRRTFTGGFRLADAVPLERLEAMSDELLLRALLPASALVAELPVLELGAADTVRFRQGQALAAPGRPDGAFAVFGEGRFLGVAEVAGGAARPRRVVVQKSLAEAASTA